MNADAAAPDAVPERFTAVEGCVDRVLERLGPCLNVAMPLGLGKADRFFDALYRRAREDAGIELTLYTALTLERPQGGSELERRFLGPFAERVYGDRPEPAYAADLRADRLPANVRVHEFFLAPGAWLKVPAAQQDYLSSNYTLAARDLVAREVNLIAQLLARRSEGERERLSLACNPDVTPQLLEALRARSDRCVLAVGEIHTDLPFMEGEAAAVPARFDLLLEPERPAPPLFVVPNEPVRLAQHAIAAHVASLVPDGGTLQLGIGAQGDAVAHMLAVRHRRPERFAELAEALSDTPRGELRRDLPVEREPFERGLYGCTEMFTHGFLHLRRVGVLGREVLPDAAVQQRLDAEPDSTPAALIEGLARDGELGERLEASTVARLRRLGLVSESASEQDGRLLTPDGEPVGEALTDPAVVERLVRCAADEGPRGIWLHAGFFLGPGAFYEGLRALPEDELAGIDMTRVTWTNSALGQTELKTAQRRAARFVNSTMMVTLLGAAVSDALEDGRVVSGVGGQFDFVAQAHALPGARSVLTLPATRGAGDDLRSNLRWRYGHVTIPRHLRDVVVTEYGAADLRGRTDAEVVAALLAIADSRCQPELLEAARAAGKLPADHRIPEACRANTPERLAERLRGFEDVLPYFPLATDFDATEALLAVALHDLRRDRGRRRALVARAWQGRRFGSAAGPAAAALERMALARPRGLRERFLAALVHQAVASVLADARPISG